MDQEHYDDNDDGEDYRELMSTCSVVNTGVELVA